MGLASFLPLALMRGIKLYVVYQRLDLPYIGITVPGGFSLAIVIPGQMPGETPSACSHIEIQTASIRKSDTTYT